MKKAKFIEDLFTKEYIFNDISQNYIGRVFKVSTIEIAKNKSKWATNVVMELFGIKRMELKNEAYYFSYIKFAKNKDDMIWGIVGGKSQFHHKYSSDVCFYDICKEKKEASNFMCKNELTWYKDEILILTNLNNNLDKEAHENEEMLQKKYKLFS
ncbi:hypothetical protein CCS79_09110 [Clostridium diolis]|uniref:hypothetical protein n=1 Tax=Clostridium diolis TaxID=223919 RepID=UPI000B3FB817|nr:hypothetical protein [Clostridium diolis]OVE69073.1 hypothetical protein CCS79_09110 [Clostridium diolis]